VTDQPLSSGAQRGLAYLWGYVKQHGTAEVTRDHKTADGFRLGRWVANRRHCRGMCPELDRLLESLPGWTWSVWERDFEERLAQYREVAEAGRLSRHKALGEWAARQSQRARKGDVSADRLEQLRAAGLI
jgi:Helicase associated domain